MFFEGIAVGAFVDDKKSGRYLNAPFFTGLTLKQAVEKAEREFDSPYDKSKKSGRILWCVPLLIS